MNPLPVSESPALSNPDERTIEARTSCGDAARTPIATLPAADLNPQQFAQDYLNPGRPLLIQGAIPRETDWTLDYLTEVLGDTPLPIQDHGKSHQGEDKQQWQGTGSGVDSLVMPFRDYAAALGDRTAHAQDWYMGKCALDQTPLGQAPEFGEIEQRLGMSAPVTPWSFWMGPSGHVTHLHYDCMDGVLMQFHGAKHVILFPPSQLYNLYPFSLLKQLIHGPKLRAGHSRVYPDQPDFAQFPRLQEALNHRYDVLLERGDALYIPAGWWHEVIALGDDVTCSVNRFWHVPLGRGLTSWSKWRVHLGSLLAIPHLLKELIEALVSGDRPQKLHQWRLKL